MKQINTDPIILASGSPRRKDLLRKAGLVFDVKAADIDEEAVPYEGNPGHYTRTLSALKAETIAQAYKDTWVIGADTIVVADQKILGKPQDRKTAVDMLTNLSNCSHFVYTGYTITHLSSDISISKAVETRVIFKEMSDKEIQWYADTDEPYDKAGAYGIQGIGGFMVREIQGSYSNVVGLPVCEILETMTQLNMIRY